MPLLHLGKLYRGRLQDLCRLRTFPESRWKLESIHSANCICCHLLPFDIGFAIHSKLLTRASLENKSLGVSGSGRKMNPKVKTPFRARFRRSAGRTRNANGVKTAAKSELARTMGPLNWPNAGRSATICQIYGENGKMEIVCCMRF